jgi:protein phosphatase
MRIDSFGMTDTGQARDSNEDAILVEDDARLFAVADGVGGLNAGEIASGIAVGVLESSLGSGSGPRKSVWSSWRRDLDATQNEITDAIMNAHARIRDEALKHGNERMASTIAALVVREDRVTVAHVGDSRVYMLRDGTLTPLTRDHSALTEFIDAGLPLTEEQIKNFPYRNFITRGLGLKDTVEPTVHRLSAKPGDVFLLCSDGLTCEVTEPEIEAVLEQVDSAEKACRALVDLANQRGGSDNVSVVVVRLLG